MALTTFDGPRREALLGLGAAQSVAEVTRIAQDQLTLFGIVRAQITAGLHPADDSETPYLGFRVGDRIVVPDEAGTGTQQRVMALTVSMDDNGQITYAPDLSDVIQTDKERWEENLKKMANGTLRGTSKAATPVADIAKRYINPPALPTTRWNLQFGGDDSSGLPNRMTNPYTLDVNSTVVEWDIYGKILEGQTPGIMQLCKVVDDIPVVLYEGSIDSIWDESPKFTGLSIPLSAGDVLVCVQPANSDVIFGFANAVAIFDSPVISHPNPLVEWPPTS